MYSGRLIQERDRLIERDKKDAEGDRVREKEFELTRFFAI